MPYNNDAPPHRARMDAMPPFHQGYNYGRQQTRQKDDMADEMTIQRYNTFDNTAGWWGWGNTLHCVAWLSSMSLTCTDKADWMMRQRDPRDNTLTWLITWLSSISLVCANVAGSYHNRNAEQVIGGAALCKQQQGDEGAKGSRTSNQWCCVVRTLARGEGKGKHRGAKGDARSSSARGWMQDQWERGSHIATLLMIPRRRVETCVKCATAELC